MPARKKRTVTKGGASRKRTDRDVNRAIAGGKASAAVVLEERRPRRERSWRGVTRGSITLSTMCSRCWRMSTRSTWSRLRTAGTASRMLLNHAAAPIAGLNDDIVTGVIDKRARTAYAFVIAAITAISQRYLGRALPIVVHGYDYPVPDGRGFLGGFWLLPGPWLKPGFEEKGFEDLVANTALMSQVMDRFNNMLRNIAAQFTNVHYIDLRTTLANDQRYRTYWANELHPTERGFSMVASQFAALINNLP